MAQTTFQSNYSPDGTVSIPKGSEFNLEFSGEFDVNHSDDVYDSLKPLEETHNDEAVNDAELLLDHVLASS